MPVQENVFTSSFVRQIPITGSVPYTGWKPDGAPFQAGFGQNADSGTATRRSSAESLVVPKLQMTITA
jgi:hypothetical protein